MDTWPDHVRDALTQRLISCGKLLADPRVFCRPSIEDARNWDSLIDAWANDDRLPLFVRHNGKQAVRGSTVGHADGRNLIFVDNSPAHWAWSKATMGDCPDIESLASSMKDGCDRSIPLAFILTGAESKDDGNQSSTTALAGAAGKDFLLGARGLKLAHIDAVRLAGKGPIEHRRLDDLKQHFKRLMKPSNMFVVPLKLQGLAEVEDVIECFRGWSDVPDAEALLKAVMHETGSEEVTFTSPPPWKDIYPPKGFIEAISGALDRVQAETIHYYGLADETILRCLCSRDCVNVSVTDMAGWWGADAGSWDIDVAAPNPISRLPPELSNVSFYHEGAPRKFQALIQDMRIADGDQLLLHRRMTGGPHCVAYLGAAIEQCHQTGDYEWQEGLDYVIGIWKGHSGAKQ